MLQVNLNVTYSSNKNSIKTLSNKTLFPENVQLNRILSVFLINGFISTADLTFCGGEFPI